MNPATRLHRTCEKGTSSDYRTVGGRGGGHDSYRESGISPLYWAGPAVCRDPRLSFDPECGRVCPSNDPKTNIIAVITNNYYVHQAVHTRRFTNNVRHVVTNVQRSAAFPCLELKREPAGSFVFKGEGVACNREETVKIHGSGQSKPLSPLFMSCGSSLILLYLGFPAGSGTNLR
jgi:hypothetical protein